MEIRKLTLADADGRPVAVQIPYDDWLEIERRLNRAAPPLEVAASRRELAASARRAWQGGDGLAFQQRIREEWDERTDQGGEAR